MKTTALARLMEKVCINEETGCWEWTGTVIASGYGYGHTRVGGVSTGSAHRAMYMEVVGPIPVGLDLDHVCHSMDLDCPGGFTCRHRRCVNPDHLEPVTRLENIRRGRLKRGRKNAAKTHCPSGHPYDEVNTYRACGRRYCRACIRERQANPSREDAA